MESAVTDLPEPDSPTSATVSPRLMSKLTPFTASTALAPEPKVTARSLICRSASLMRSPSCHDLPGIERVAHGLADEQQQRQHECYGEERGESEPRRVEVVLGLQHQLAERRRAGGQTIAQEVERRERGHGAGQDEGQEGQACYHG